MFIENFKHLINSKEAVVEKVAQEKNEVSTTNAIMDRILSTLAFDVTYSIKGPIDTSHPLDDSKSITVTLTGKDGGELGKFNIEVDDPALESSLEKWVAQVQETRTEKLH